MAVTLDDLGGWRAVLLALTSGRDLTADEGRAAMTEILAGAATDAQIAAYIVALRMKGEAVDEVAGMVDAMLEASDPITIPADADAAGRHRRHRRRPDPAATTRSTCRPWPASWWPAPASTSASTATARPPRPAARSTCSRRSASPSTSTAPGSPAAWSRPALGFCFARAFHPAMRHAGPVRAELGIPTVFNFLGPLSNPARVDRQVIGVNDPAMAPDRRSACCSSGARPGPWSCTATTAWTSSPSPAARRCGRSATATCRSTTSTPATSASTSSTSTRSPAATPRPTPPSPAGCSPASPARTATSSRSTRRPAWWSAASSTTWPPASTWPAQSIDSGGAVGRPRAPRRGLERLASLEPSAPQGRGTRPVRRVSQRERVPAAAAA